ncbi:ABC transporter ATP-binding protein [Candidatus Binatia bacterium]|nr:ABC transporter ATP-binding protein [Candidatus Binatia bacterium]
MHADPVISLRGLRKRYGRRVALHGVDLELHGGQIVGVVGPDGAGKTTLMRTLAGLLDVEAERAVVLGHDLRADVTALKARIGYVPQVFSLNRDLSIFENLNFTGRVHRLPAAVFASRTEALLARTGLAPFADRAAGALSGGMKQKLAVANALLAEPALLLLDEPTAGVDVVARAEIWALLEAERERALVLISTSYLDEAAGCDRLVYLDAGRAVAVGTPAELEASIPLDAYVAWADDPRAAAAAARQLPYAAGARVSGLMTRVEVHRTASPGRERVLADLRALPGVNVQLASAVPIDMETTLLALARGVA